MNNNKLYIMIGLPGSGKSTWSNKFIEENPNTYIVSTDSIRKELYGSEDIQGSFKEIAKVRDQRIHESLEDGVNVIYDATNLKRAYRKEIIEIANVYNKESVAVVMDTPYETCLEQNSSRERHVPEEVIEKMQEGYQEPLLSEGFSQILNIELERPKEMERPREEIFR